MHQEQRKVILTNQLKAISAVGAMEDFIGQDSRSVEILRGCTPRETATIIFGIVPSLSATRETEEVDARDDEVLLEKATHFIKVMTEEHRLKGGASGGEGIPSRG